MRRRLEDAVAVWQAWRDQAAPLPRVRADVGAWLPGWLVRLVAALVTGATAGLGLWLAGAHGPALVAGLLGLAWTALAPSTASWAVCAAFLAVTRLATGTDHATGLAWALAVAGLAYAACRTTWWAAHVTPRGRVSRRALAGPARRDALVLLGVGLEPLVQARWDVYRGAHDVIIAVHRF